jgi:hypothetical protein
VISLAIPLGMSADVLVVFPEVTTAATSGQRYLMSRINAKAFKIAALARASSRDKLGLGSKISPTLGPASVEASWITQMKIAIGKGPPGTHLRAHRSRVRAEAEQV